MRISFINPPSPDGTIYMKELGRCGRRAIVGEVWPQTGLAYLAAVAGAAGADVQLIDGMGAGLSPEETLKEITKFKPQLVLVHVTTPTASNDREFCYRIKKSYYPAVVGVIGTHPTALREEMLEPGIIDVVIVGEAEGTIEEICRRNSFTEKIRGIIHSLNKDEIVDGGERPLIENLDDLPFPARDFLPVKNYTMPFFGNDPFLTVIPGRGCPFHCSFCRAGSVWGHKVRLRSVENIITELREIVEKYGIRNIVFMTDLFTINARWVTDLCNAIIKSKLGIEWICNSRVDGITPGLAKTMAATGCQMISFGLESGDDEILKTCHKQINLKQSEDAVQWTKDAGMLAFGYFIIGLPGETWETVEKTIKTAIRINPDYALFHLATPFPGTELYEWAKKRGYLISEDWADYDEEDGKAMRTEAMSLEDLQRAKRIATRRFYWRPSKIIQGLRQIRSWPDCKAKIHAACKITKNLLR